MLSAGMFTSLASAMIVRKRGFIEGSPPPFLAATVSSLMMRVKILPRFASAAPFLCLIVCHLEWPDIAHSLSKMCRDGPEMLPRSRGRRQTRRSAAVLHLSGQDQPGAGGGRQGAASVVPIAAMNAQPNASQPVAKLVERNCPERQSELAPLNVAAPPLDELVVEDRESASRLLADGLRERDATATTRRPAED